MLPSLKTTLSVIYDPAVRKSNWLIPRNYSDTLQKCQVLHTLKPFTNTAYVKETLMLLTAIVNVQVRCITV